MVMLDIKHNLTTAYHPQSNGQAERTNQTMGQGLMQMELLGKQWESALPLIEMAINSKTLPGTEYNIFLELWISSNHAFRS